jgi:trigger factor
MSLKIDLKEKEGLVREVTIEVPADTVKSEIDKQLAEVRRKVTLKGFRKGKAPMDRIKSLYGNEAMATAADELIKNTYPEAIKEKVIRAAAPPMVTDLKFNDDGSMLYTARVEVMPEIDKVDYNGLELVRTEFEVEDREVDEVVHYYRMRFSDVRKVEREAQDKDVVTVDLKKLYDPKLIMKDDSFNDMDIDLGRETTIREFREQIPGMKAGDEKEIEVQYAEDYPDEHFAGATIKYLVKVKEVKERVLPEFDDALAKQSGQGETALELKLKIRDDIKREKENQQRKQHKNEIIRQLCRKNEIPIPEVWVEDYLKGVAEDYKKHYPHSDEKKVRESYRETGIDAMRWNLLMYQLSKQENIEVLPSDTENWIKGFAESNGVTVEQAREHLNRSGKTDQIKEAILEDKVLTFLIDKAEMLNAAPQEKE